MVQLNDMPAIISSFPSAASAKCLQFRLRFESLLEDARELIQQVFPLWANHALEFVPLSAGTTNKRNINFYFLAFKRRHF
jgi:hypothetical protein